MNNEMLQQLQREAEEGGKKLNAYWYALYSEEKTCQFCGRSFVGLKWAKWCSDACKVKAYRERKRKGGDLPPPQSGSGGDDA